MARDGSPNRRGRMNGWTARAVSQVLRAHWLDGNAQPRPGIFPPKTNRENSSSRLTHHIRFSLLLQKHSARCHCATACEPCGPVSCMLIRACLHAWWPREASLPALPFWHRGALLWAFHHERLQGFEGGVELVHAGHHPGELRLWTVSK